MKHLIINDEELQTINVNGKDIDYDIDAFADQYEKRRTLPSPKIVCTKTGKLITCFGNNLHGKVQKYGGIRNLLESFVCKAAGGATRSSGQAAKEPQTVEEISKEIEELNAKLEILKQQQEAESEDEMEEMEEEHATAEHEQH